MILADSLRNLVGVGWLPNLIIMALPLMSYLPMAATFAFAPGPDATLTIRSSLSGGRSHGLATGLGTASGSVVWGLASAVGLAALVVSQPALFATLKVTGAVYLAFLGLQSLNSSVRTHRSARQQSAAARHPLPLRPLLQRAGLRRSDPQRPTLRETEPQHFALQQPMPQHSPPTTLRHPSDDGLAIASTRLPYRPSRFRFESENGGLLPGRYAAIHSRRG